MKGEKRLPLLIIVLICCLFAAIPFQGYAADLTISNILTSTGDWSVNGIIHATYLGGDGSALTNVTASGLSCTGCVSLPQINTSQVQSRVGSSCVAGSSIRVINSNGTVVCQTDTNSGGTVTQVNSGTGLTGGPITATGILSVNFGGNGAANTAARSDHTHDIYQKKYAQVAVVDAMGRGDYYSPVTAMNNVGNWCGNPTELNPCVVKIMPGFYDVGQSSVTMLPYVDIEGSGENVTIIEGNIGVTVGVVHGADNTEIRFLTVRNRGGEYAIAILNDSSSKITNVTATASGGTSNYGVYNTYSSPTMSNVTATASGGAYSIGVFNQYSSPTMSNVTATASGGTATNYGISNGDSSPTMSNVTATASGGLYSYGVFNGDSSPTISSSPTMSNVTATASGGTYSYGVNNHYSSPTMSNVTATATTGTNNYGIYNDYSSPKILGVTVTASGGTKSHGIYNTHSSPTVDTATIIVSGASLYNYGIFNEQASTAYLTNVTSNASGGVDSFGILNANTGASITVDHCRLSGQRSVRNDNSLATIFIGSSKLNGNIVATGNIKCVGVYDGSYSAITCP